MNYTKHTLKMGRKCGPMQEVIDILQLQEKGLIVGVWYCMYGLFKKFVDSVCSLPLKLCVGCVMWFCRQCGMLLFPIHSWFCVCVCE